MIARDYVFQKVVAGILYDLTVQFTPPGSICEVDHFQVGNRFGKIILMKNEVLETPCE
jgi:hypothetical protein